MSDIDDMFLSLTSDSSDIFEDSCSFLPKSSNLEIEKNQQKSPGQIGLYKKKDSKNDVDSFSEQGNSFHFDSNTQQISDFQFDPGIQQNSLQHIKSSSQQMPSFQTGLSNQPNSFYQMNPIYYQRFPFFVNHIIYNLGFPVFGNYKRSNIFKKNSSRSSYLNSSRKVSLSQDEQKFKNDFYNVFGKKRFNKFILRKIHNNYLVPNLKIKEIERNEFRSINTYFHHRFSRMDEIIKFLNENKNELRRNCF